MANQYGIPLAIRKSQLSEAVEKIRRLPDRSPEQLNSAPDGAQANEIRPRLGTVERLEAEARTAAVNVINAVGPPEDDEPDNGDEDILPQGWSKGALLNVRNRGDHYCVTLYPEEYDPRHPERALTFPNTWECQDFVSKWYARETADPRAR